MSQKTGRPLKYAQIIKTLKDEQLYASANIGEFALETGFIDASQPKFEQIVRSIAKSCSYLRGIRKFPASGDGLVRLCGRPQSAWTGKRWKDALEAMEKTQELQATEP